MTDNVPVSRRARKRKAENSSSSSQKSPEKPKEPKSDDATASKMGYIYQTYVALYYMLKNYENLVDIVEEKGEDFTLITKSETGKETRTVQVKYHTASDLESIDVDSGLFKVIKRCPNYEGFKVEMFVYNEEKEPFNPNVENWFETKMYETIAQFVLITKYKEVMKKKSQGNESEEKTSWKPKVKVTNTPAEINKVFHEFQKEIEKHLNTEGNLTFYSFFTDKSKYTQLINDFSLTSGLSYNDILVAIKENIRECFRDFINQGSQDPRFVDIKIVIVTSAIINLFEKHLYESRSKPTQEEQVAHRTLTKDAISKKVEEITKSFQNSQSLLEEFCKSIKESFGDIKKRDCSESAKLQRLLLFQHDLRLISPLLTHNERLKLARIILYQIKCSDASMHKCYPKEGLDGADKWFKQSYHALKKWKEQYYDLCQKLLEEFCTQNDVNYHSRLARFTFHFAKLLCEPSQIEPIIDEDDTELTFFEEILPDKDKWECKRSYQNQNEYLLDHQ